MDGINDRTCILTGASGLLGKAFIDTFRLTYNIIALYNNHKVPNSIPLEAEIPKDEDPRGTVYSYCVDLSQMAEIQRLCERLKCLSNVDLLINASATYYLSNLLTGESLDPADHLMRLNLLAPLRLSVLLARQFWMTSPDENANRNRNIINISSTSSLVVYKGSGQGLYSASKAGLNHLTRYIAEDFSSIRVRANVIAPTSFPNIVSTQSVLSAIHDVDCGDMNGQIIPIASENHRYSVG